MISGATYSAIEQGAELGIAGVAALRSLARGFRMATKVARYQGW